MLGMICFKSRRLTRLSYAVSRRDFDARRRVRGGSRAFSSLALSKNDLPRKPQSVQAMTFSLPTSFVSKEELEAIIPPDAIPAAGTYIVTLKCEGEDFPESHRAHLIVEFKP